MRCRNFIDELVDVDMGIARFLSTSEIQTFLESPSRYPTSKFHVLSSFLRLAIQSPSVLNTKMLPRRVERKVGSPICLVAASASASSRLPLKRPCTLSCPETTIPSPESGIYITSSQCVLFQHPYIRFLFS